MTKVRTWWVTLDCGHSGVAARNHLRCFCKACDDYQPIMRWDRERKP